MQRTVLAVLTLTTVLTLTMVLVPAQLLASDADSVLGTWLTAPADDGRAKLEIRKEGDTYYGEIVWLEQPVYPPDDEQGMAGQTKVDRENPDVTLRKRPIIGLRLIKGFTYEGENLWIGGTIYDPENGKTYKSKMRQTENGQSLKVRGYIGFSLIGRTTEWTRVADKAKDSES